MKNKLISTIILLFTLIFIITGCNNLSTDAKKFKKEYESLNGMTKGENKIRSVNINENNPFIYASLNDIIKLIDEEETFAVYFGFSDCPWCRSIIETLIDVSNDLEIEKIYYVDIKDVRDVLVLSEDNKIIKDKDADKDYYKLVDKINNVLEDYILVDNDGNKVNTNEKRIYAPSVVSIVNGKAQSLEDGISEKQTDAYMNITEDMKKETYNSFKCSLQCIIESKNSCSKSCLNY